MTCQHDGCQCEAGAVVRDGSRYCSEYCANTGRTKGESCGCGHAQCKARDEGIEAR